MAVRAPAVAGLFYPGDAKTLRRAVRDYLADAQADPAPGGQVATVVCPHAGYRYSGPTAAYAFKRASAMTPRRVVLLGRSHHHLFDGVSVWPKGALATPLGESPVDAAFTAALVADYTLQSPHIHDREHALEVMLPFIQELYGEVPVVTLLFGNEPSSFAAEVGTRLAGLLDPGDLVVLSTDLSHYLTEREANAQDAKSIDAVLGGDAGQFAQRVLSEEIALCGATAVEAGLVCAHALGATHRQLLDYRTSAWAGGDTARVVGYAAIALERAA